MRVFVLECYVYKYDNGYDKNSPAYLVFYPDTGRVLKSRLVKFVIRSTNERDFYKICHAHRQTKWALAQLRTRADAASINEA